jgi:hypothetical protein
MISPHLVARTSVLDVRGPSLAQTTNLTNRSLLSGLGEQI